jgi:hypothetical protein
LRTERLERWHGCSGLVRLRQSKTEWTVAKPSSEIWRYRIVLSILVEIEESLSRDPDGGFAPWTPDFEADYGRWIRMYERTQPLPETYSTPRETGRQRGCARTLARPGPSGWARAPRLWNVRAFADTLARIRVALRAVATRAVAAHVAGNPVARKAIVADAVAVPAPRRRRRRLWPEQPADRCGAGPGEEGGDHPPPTKTPTEFSCEVVDHRRVHGKHPFRSRAAVEAGPPGGAESPPSNMNLFNDILHAITEHVKTAVRRVRLWYRRRTLGRAAPLVA